MKERPILFSGQMVRALLSGAKTQTRRIVKPQPEAEHGGEPYWFIGGYRAWTYRDTQDTLRKGGKVLPCPYSQRGDRLWVREAWARDDEDGALFYRADVGLGGDADDWERNRLDGVPRYRWRPSIHMPRLASRITLEVTGVRVEQLQDISEADAIAEGVNPFPGVRQDDDAAAFNRIGPVDMDSFPIARYAALWESINGPGSWDANPWVWVVEFKKIKP